MNAFEQYAKKAATIVNAPARLVGVIKTRAYARIRYSEIVAELAACEDADMLDGFLSSITPELAQFRAELDFLWEGEGDFLGLSNEIERAEARINGRWG
jgi:hypothetical protein